MQAEDCTAEDWKVHRPEIVTHVYMKLWVPDNLVLFIYHADINCSTVCGQYWAL